MTTLSPRPSLRPPLALLAAAALLGGCAHHPGTAPAPGVFWTPPRAEQASPQSAPPLQIPAELIERVGQLTLTDVLDVALRNNTATSVAWAQARVASAAYGAARGQYYPTLTLDGTVTALQTAPFGGRVAVKQQFYGPTLNVSWLLLDFGARGGSIGEARAALLAADWTHNAVIQDVVLAVESAYFQYMATKALLTAQQTTLAEARGNLAAADQRHNVGLATIADVLQARTALSQAQLALESTEGAIHTTRGALALSMGLPANVPYDIEPPPAGAPPLGIADSIDSLIERAVRERPDLMAARAQVRAAQARVSVARGNALPSLVVGGDAQQTYFFDTTPSGNSYTATITLQIPLFSGGSNIYNIKAAAAAAQAAAQQERGLERQVVFEVFRAYYTLRTATQLVRTSADLLASAKESEQVALGRYKAGAGSVLDVLTAQAALAGARAQEIQARFTWYTALAQLAHDTGILGLDGSSPLHVRTDTTETPQ
jgi:outer membrane protein TolC